MSVSFDRYTIVIPVFNQLQYTVQCVESLLRQNIQPGNILIIDNASSDDTPLWLSQHKELRQLRNRTNLGCGCAWTQGIVLSLDSEWVVLLNNDVLAVPDAIDALLNSAEREKLGVASPALLEGQNDYDFNTFAINYSQKMSGMIRRGKFHGVCFAVHRDAWEKIGFPDTDRRLGGYEDAEYFFRCKRAGIPMGFVGDSVFHHFGSITQKAIKKTTGQKSLGDLAYFRSRAGTGWLSRKRDKFMSKYESRRWIDAEKGRSGYTLHMQRHDGKWKVL
ncbi:MAG: glycosyltransferase [Chlorobium sp.]|nr:MAG: glycosyltransferase [Chlorobium sp.]